MGSTTVGEVTTVTTFDVMDIATCRLSPYDTGLSVKVYVTQHS